MIQIEHLTEYQVEMLDHMWSLDSLEEYEEWYDLLDEEDQQLADTLQQMIILAEMDNVMGNCNDAKQLLKKFAL
jgi:uncharacterized protein YukE